MKLDRFEPTKIEAFVFTSDDQHWNVAPALLRSVEET
jgi:hypothetical protein